MSCEGTHARDAQAAVAAGSLLVIAAEVTQAPNDKQQLEPMLDKIADLPGALGQVGELLADNGYFSEANVNACAAAGIEPVIAMGREAHHPSLDERFPTEEPEPPAAPLETMLYALRKHTPEPVFGIIKSVLGFRRFPPRGLETVRGEWSLVAMAGNMKRMFVLAGANRGAGAVFFAEIDPAAGFLPDRWGGLGGGHWFLSLKTVPPGSVRAISASQDEMARKLTPTDGVDGPPTASMCQCTGREDLSRGGRPR